MVFGNRRENSLKIPWDYEDLFKELERRKYAKKKLEHFGQITPFVKYQKKTDGFHVFVNKVHMEMVLERKKKVKVRGNKVTFY